MNSFRKICPDNVSLQNVIFGDDINECETCLVAKGHKLPFKTVRNWTDHPLQILHADTLGPISPPSYPERYKFVVTFTDDKSRTVLEYAGKHKNDVGTSLEDCVRSLRNVIGTDEKFCFRRYDQGTELTVAGTVEILN